VESSSQNVTIDKRTPSFSGRVLFLSPNQQSQSTERKKLPPLLLLITTLAFRSTGYAGSLEWNFGDCWWDTFTGWKPLRTPTNSVKALTAKMKKTMHLDSNLSLAFVLDNIRSRSLVHHAEWSLADWTTDLDFLTWDFPFVSNVHYGQTQHSV